MEMWRLGVSGAECMKERILFTLTTGIQARDMVSVSSLSPSVAKHVAHIQLQLIISSNVKVSDCKHLSNGRCYCVLN